MEKESQEMTNAQAPEALEGLLDNLVIKAQDWDGHARGAQGVIDAKAAIMAEFTRLAALRTAPSPLAPAEGLEAAYKAGFDSGAWCHATFHGWDNASAEAGWQGFKSRAPAPPLTDTPVEGEKLVPWTQPKPDCELCKGSGFYGDRGPGRKGNAEYIRCDCTQPASLTATAPGPGMIADVSRHDWGDTIVFRKGSKDVAIVECTHEEAEEICGKFAQPPAPAPGEAE